MPSPSPNKPKYSSDHSHPPGKKKILDLRMAFSRKKNYLREISNKQDKTMNVKVCHLPGILYAYHQRSTKLEWFPFE